MTKFKLSSVPVLTFSVIWTTAGKNIWKKIWFPLRDIQKGFRAQKISPEHANLEGSLCTTVHTHTQIIPYNAQITAEEKKKLSLLLKYLTALSWGLFCCEPPPAAGSSFTPNSQIYDLYGLLTQTDTSIPQCAGGALLLNHPLWSSAHTVWCQPETTFALSSQIYFPLINKYSSVLWSLLIQIIIWIITLGWGR